MAGGMNKRGSGIPLGQRVRDGAAPMSAPSSAPASVPASVPSQCPVRHCWVSGAADHQGEKRPGLLVEWRRTPEGWEGLVVYAASLRAGEWALVEEWLPAGLLTPC